jgi:hypothetical protein
VFAHLAVALKSVLVSALKVKAKRCNTAIVVTARKADEYATACDRSRDGREIICD